MKKKALVWFIAMAFYSLVALLAQRTRVELGNPAVPTGWALAFLILFLASFNLRKRLSMIPLGSAATWLLLHVVGGILAVALFWRHTGRIWPSGIYEQILGVFFYALTLSGIVGYIFQKIYPPRLTQSGLEIIYERIPAELAQIREQAEKLVLQCTQETQSDTLAKHYLETLDWFFRRPRFHINHVLGGQKGVYWIQSKFGIVKKYLTEVECRYLDQLVELAVLKNKVDFHFIAQSLMKGWLLMHVPLTAGFLLLVLWHVLVVHVYAL